MYVRRSLRWLLGTGIAVCACTTASAAELPVFDFVRIPKLTHPAISPDGKHLAIIVNEKAESTKARYQVTIAQLPDLKPMGRLTTGERYVSARVEWVSDTRLVIELWRGIGSLASTSWVSSIIAVNDDGSHEKTLYTRGPDGNKFPGIWLLHGLHGIPALAGTPHPANGHFFLTVDYESPGSLRDAWQHGSTELLDVDGTTGRAAEIGQIQHAKMKLMAYGGVARIASGYDSHMHAVAFYSTDGKHWTPMPTATVGEVFEPLGISRDGKHLYVLSSLDGGPNRLISCNLDGSGRKLLASDPFSSVTDEMWNPVTGMPIAAIFTANGKPRVQYMGDGPYVQILQAVARGQPGEFVDLKGASADGSRLLVDMGSDRDPGDFVLLDKATLHAQLLFRPEPWIVPSQMPHRLPIHFRNRSGMELAGFLTLPLGEDKNLPLVLVPHGGPIGIADTWFFNPWAALLANRGYAVLQINYRGSSGRGKNFEHAGFGQFGTGIQDDLIDGVKWAIAKGYANPNRICVFGGSFGGYSALMQPILAPKYYKCAIDYAGVYDWRIEMHKSDTSRTASGRWYFTHAIGTAQTAYAISPASRLEQFNAPVLIAHGKDDPRVPYRNATELRSALNKAGKPYQWLAEPGQGHGFISEKDNEKLFSMITAFLARYIGSKATSVASTSK